MSPRFLPLAAIVLLAVCGTAAQAIACWLEPDRKARNISAPFEWRGLVLGIGLIILSIAPDLASLAVYYLWGDE